MKNQIIPSYTTIGDIFGKNFLFEVPKYQRYYSWENEQIEDYIKDINNIYLHIDEDKTIEHFFGGIVVVNKPIPGSNRSQRELIDGQQRITTTILLVIALINKYKDILSRCNDTLSPEYKESINDSIEKLKYKYLYYKDKVNRVSKTVEKLVLSNADAKFFSNIINNNEITTSRESHKRIKKAFTKLTNFVNSKVDDLKSIDDKIDAISKIEDIIHNNCTIIFIDSQTRESAYKLFQVLNDRGAGLTEGDLLKSITLESLEKHFDRKQSVIESEWDDILQDESKTTEKFLRYFYASVCGKRVGRTSLYDDFLKKFFPELTNTDCITEENDAIKVVDTVSNILKEIRIYRKLINGVWPYDSQQPITEWERKRLDILVNYLNFDIIYPILLAGAQLKEKKFAELVHMLEKFMFRYKSVCNLGHQKLSDLFMTEAVKIREDPENYKLNGLRNTLREYIKTDCNDLIFKAGLSNLRYRTSGNNKQLKYFFSTINEHIVWYSNGAVGNPKPNTGNVINYDNVTIEHISSQSASNPLPEFSGDKVHSFYNLTLLTVIENDTAKSKEFLLKKPIYENSVYEINKYFSNVGKWDYSEATNWKNYLEDFACKVFVV